MSGITADYHIHSRLSPDGHCSMIDLCETAVKLGLTEVAMTDHFEFYTPDVDQSKGGKPVFFYPFNQEYLDRYFSLLQQCREALGDRLRILSGIEIGQPYVNPDYAREIMAHNSWDFVIGSVHKLDNIDLGQMDYPEIDLNQLAERNLSLLYRMADQEDFDVLGHVDLIKRYAARRGVTVHLRDYPDQLMSIFRRLAERGKGIEINTSGIRQEAGEALPSLEILKLYRQAGGEIVTVGSDAHVLEHLGKDFDIVADMLRQAGFSYLTRYRSRVPEFYPLD